MDFRIFSYSNNFSYHHLLAPDPKKRLMHEYCKILAKIRKLKGTRYCLHSKDYVPIAFSFYILYLHARIILRYTN